jgi:hypothetical protein
MMGTARVSAVAGDSPLGDLADDGEEHEPAGHPSAPSQQRTPPRVNPPSKSPCDHWERRGCMEIPGCPSQSPQPISARSRCWAKSARGWASWMTAAVCWARWSWEDKITSTGVSRRRSLRQAACRNPCVWVCVGVAHACRCEGGKAHSYTRDDRAPAPPPAAPRSKDPPAHSAGNPRPTLAGC